MSAHRPVLSDKLPRPVGPYSPGMQFERLVFVSGQGATDPATGELAGADIETQTEQCLRNIQTILQAAGSDLGYVLRCGVFLTDMREFTRMNGVYQRLFGDHRPARTTVQAAALPLEALHVEIDAIAYVPAAGGATRPTSRGARKTGARKASKAAAGRGTASGAQKGGGGRASKAGTARGRKAAGGRTSTRRR